MIQKNDRRSGVALVLTALICLAMVPMIGLAIDGANAYLLRSQLSSALDGAVLAGARSLSGSSDVGTQRGNADAVAQQVFTASLSNLSSSISSIVQTSFCVGSSDGMGADANCPVQGTGQTGNSYRWVNGTATANLPLSMLSLIPGIAPAPLSVTASAQRRDVNLMLVLDHSYPLATVAGVFSTLQTDATTFVNMFANGRDALGLVTYTGSAYLAYAPATTFLSDSTNIPTQIAALPTPVYPASGNAAAAIWLAYQQLPPTNTSLNPGALNVVVLFTGGVADSFTGAFTPTAALAASCPQLRSTVTGVIWDVPFMTLFGLLSDPTTNSIIDAPDLREAPSAGGCAGLVPGTSQMQMYSSSFGGFTGMPTADVNGNSTNGTGSIGEYNSAVGSSMITLSKSTIPAAAENALDDAANKMRTNGTLIYTIGLFGLLDTGPKADLLTRIANVGGSTSASQPAGLYLAAPSVSQLSSLFAQVASQEIKLAY